MEATKIYHMLHLTIVLALVTGVQLQVDKSPSHFEFLGLNFLGRQDELNQTLQGVAKQVTTLLPVAWKVNSTVTYSISNVKPTFKYNPSQQKAAVLGDNTVLIQGEGVYVQFTFNWSRSGSGRASGKGVAGGKSDMLVFAYSGFKQAGQFFKYKIYDYEPVVWSSSDAFQIDQIQPIDVTIEDKENIRKLINRVDGVRTVKDTLQLQIQKYFPSFLSEIIQTKSQLPKDNFDYSWVDADRLNHTLQFESRPLHQQLDQSGLRTRYETEIVDSTKWKSGKRHVPNHPLNETLYGSTQECISFDFYENVLHEASTKGILTTTLNRKNWGTQTFDFTAGRLGFYFKGISERFSDFEKVDGECNLVPGHNEVEKEKTASIHVEFQAKCHLSILETNITSFKLKMSVNANIIVYNSALYFVFIDHELTSTVYEQEQDFPLRSKQLMDIVVDLSLSNLANTPLFGSAWPLNRKRTQPVVVNTEDFTLIYDEANLADIQKQWIITEQ